jgi:hypothetical protein
MINGALAKMALSQFKKYMSENDISQVLILEKNGELAIESIKKPFVYISSEEIEKYKSEFQRLRREISNRDELILTLKK